MTSFSTFLSDFVVAHSTTVLIAGGIAALAIMFTITGVAGRVASWLEQLSE